MRNAFLETLVKRAEEDPDLWLFCGDLGYSVLEPFIKKFPERFLNAGISEQNMVSMAAGLALSGKNVFVYSIINFATLRCFEQIRNDVCYHNANVKIVGVGSGLSYGPQGYTHHAVEDIAAMRALPRMTVLCPGDPLEACWATNILARQPGPGYLRLAKAGEPTLHKIFDMNLPTGKAMRLEKGDDLTLIATGNMLETALAVRGILAKFSFSAGVVSMPSLKPFDDAFVASEARRVPLLATLEEHTKNGGLAEAVSFAMSTAPEAGQARLIGFYTPEDICLGLVGDQAGMRRLINLAPDQIAAELQAVLQKARN